MKSTPFTAAAVSSVIRSRAPDFAAKSLAILVYSSDGHRLFGPQMRTSMPSRQPTISSECPMLERVSPT
jgi:hypothetical protein